MNTLPKSMDELVAERILVRTGRRILGLSVEIADQTVTLRGRAQSFYVKQLALHGVREVMPNATLCNAIVVGA